MINHIIHRGKAKYESKKKTILLIIKKQPGEIDWILPILYKLKNDFNIIAVFEKNLVLKQLKENKILYKLFSEVAFSFVENLFFKSIFLRLAKKISLIFKIKRLTNFIQNKIYESYYDIFKLEQDIKKKYPHFNIKSLKFLMQDLADNSAWTNKFYENDKSLNIIYYPHTTNICSSLINFNINKINFKINSFLLINSFYDVIYFKNRFIETNKFISGYPKYDKSWLNKLDKFYKKKIQTNRKIFITYKGFQEGKYSKIMYIEQVKALFDFVEKKKNISLVFKFHPNAQEEKVFMSVANKFSKHLWKIEKDHLHILYKNSDVSVAFYKNASILESLACGKAPIQLWNISNNKNIKSVYSKLKLCFVVKDSLSLDKKLNFLLDNTKPKTQKLILKRFKKICGNINSIERVYRLILKISKLKS
tara:strand:- start:2457 stop:3716 length:1260 start_codon:yes stop_codon:yes gene_type:complete